MHFLHNEMPGSVDYSLQLINVTHTMTAKLRFDGFYYSGPIAWEEWHAGVRMHGVRHHYYRYYPNGDWIHCYRDMAFDFWDFTESVTAELLTLAKSDRAPRVGDQDPLCTAGEYTIDKGILHEIFSPTWVPGKTFKMKVEVLEDGILRNKRIIRLSQLLQRLSPRIGKMAATLISHMAKSTIHFHKH